MQTQADRDSAPWWLKAVAGGGALLVAAGVAALIVVAADHKVQPKGTLDYGDLAVAVGTLILALVTVSSVVLGWIALRDTRDEIEISRTQASYAAAQAEYARRQVENGQRPILIPAIDDSSTLDVAKRYGLPLGTKFEIRIPATRPEPIRLPLRPHVFNGAVLTLIVPVRNIGTGPALAVQIVVVALDIAGNPTAPEKVGRGYVASIATDETVPLPVPLSMLDGVPNFDVTLTYRDLAEKAWSTSARYCAEGEGGLAGYYTDPKVGEAHPIELGPTSTLGSAQVRSAPPIEAGDAEID